MSPDHTAIAVAIHRANAATNSYCSGLYLVPIGRSPVLVDSGPGLILWKFPNFDGKAGFPTGFPKVRTPQWSPDGRFVAYLKPVNGKAQIWAVDRDGSNSRALTDIADGVESFRFDDMSIVLSVKDRSSAAKARTRESLSGFHYDNRFYPVAGGKPYLRAPIQSRVFDLNPQTRELRPLPGGADDKGPSDRGDWRPVLRRTASGEERIGASKGSSAPVLCSSALCVGVVGEPWLAPDGKAIYFLRHEGWARETAAIYEWTIAASEPKVRYRTTDDLLGCSNFETDIICEREGSTRPRYISRIDLASGRSTTLFDPNPEFSRHQLGRVERLHWRNDLGIESFGDLVLPPDYVPGLRYPLILVQYDSRGFLRGGTGDEFPIQLFARNGYLVLSIEHPLSPATVLDHLSGVARQRRDLAGFRERRSILSSYETIVHRLIREGLVDSHRVGITGLSDGSSTAQFAMVHSNLFAAASVVGCCWEPSQAWLLGAGTMRHFRAVGWPSGSEGHRRFWHEISLAENAGSIKTPILIDAADDEYLASLESVEALKLAGDPVDLYVFPGEHHVKWQPAHRLAIYQRNLDWFNFWLKGEMPAHAPDHAQESTRWEEFNVKQGK